MVKQKNPGKELQDLVRRIEAAVGKDCDVKSPDFLPDRFTGTLREVDVSIRAKAASQALLIIEECRDHKRRVGVQFVEQVVQKRDDVQADKAVIVSTTGFTTGGAKKAVANNIDLLTVSQAMREDWRKWMACTSLSVYRQSYEIKHTYVELTEESPPPPSGEAPEGFTSDGQLNVHSTIFFNLDGSEWGSIAKLVNGVIQKHEDVYGPIQPGTGKRLRALNINLDGPPIHVKTGSTLSKVSRVLVFAEFWIELEEVPIRQIAYRRNDGDLVAEYADASFSMPSVTGDSSIECRVYMVRDDEETQMILETKPAANP